MHSGSLSHIHTHTPDTQTNTHTNKHTNKHTHLWTDASMFVWSLLRCLVLVCVTAAQAYEDDIDLTYVGPNYFNEITEGDTPEPTAASCGSADLTRWDKVFSMLENSQMRENMLLQYTDDIIKVELGSLRAEMLRFVAQYGGACGVAVETAGRRMSVQMESRLREMLERHSKNNNGGGNSDWLSNHQEALFQQLLSTVRAQGQQLAKLESSCLGQAGGRLSAAGRQKQEVMSAEGAAALAAELKLVRAELELVVKSNQQRHLPAGCETALLFPMRSRRIYTSVTPDLPLSLSSFTVCLWAKPVSVANRTVLLSYGTQRNPYEIQLLFSGTSALFTVGGEAHLVEGQGAAKAGAWTHLCGAWSSEQGLAALWADGRAAASSPGVAEGHVLPSQGTLQLGQERSDCSRGDSGSGVLGFDAGFDAKLAFAGKMTGVNVWDRVLAEDEIAQLVTAGGCEQRGNVVAWGVTEMLPHGGAQFVN